MSNIESITNFFSYDQDHTANYGSVDYRGTIYGFVQVEDEYGKIHPIDEYLTNTGRWFIHKFVEDYHDGTRQKMAFIDNWGNLWSSQWLNFQSAACSRPSILRMIKSGTGTQLTDRCIEKLKSGEWVITTGNVSDKIEAVHTVFMTYVSMFQQIQ
jgi:hypothetical protein